MDRDWKNGGKDVFEYRVFKLSYCNSSKVMRYV